MYDLLTVLTLMVWGEQFLTLGGLMSLTDETSIWLSAYNPLLFSNYETLNNVSPTWNIAEISDCD